MKNRQKVVAFDVDGTLIDEDDVLRADVLDILLDHHSKGDTIVVWSGGGVTYARTWVSRLRLTKYVDAVAAKGSLDVDVAYDDQPVKLGKENFIV